MPPKSNQSVLRKLLAEIEDEDGTFTYDEKEAKEIDWTAYDRAQINEINDVLKAIRDVVDQAVKNLNMRERHEEELKKNPVDHPRFQGIWQKLFLYSNISIHQIGSPRD